MQHLQGKFIHILRQVQHLVAVGQHRLHLRQQGNLLHAVSGGKVDLLLILLHAGDIFLQGHIFPFKRGLEQQQILQQIPVHAVIAVKAPFQLRAEGLKELLVFLPVALQHLLQLGSDLLLQRLFNQPQLAVLLQHLPGNVQGQIRTVHNAPDEAEIVRNQFLAAVHDQHTAGVELQALFIVAAVEVEGSMGRDEEQRLIVGRAFVLLADHLQRRLVIVELIPVEVGICLLRHLRGGLLPDRDHAVQRLVLFDRFVLILGAFFKLAVLRPHLDGVADVIAVLFDQTADTILVQIFAVLFILGIFLQMQNDLRARGLFFAGAYGVAVSTAGFPLVGLVGPVGPAADRDLIGHHKGRIEADTELADDIDLLL